MRRTDICLYLGPADRAELQALLTNRNTPRKLVWRADIVLATADGRGTVEIMRRTGMSKPTVWRWQERYLDEGVPGLKRDKTRPSRVPPLPREVRLKVIAKTVQETPPNATHWSRTTMAEAVGISPSSVGRIWADAGLKPHIVKEFKVSNDPMFEEKVTDIVGLYLNPPDRAVVLCVDEKSQIQALDRTQPGLPLKKGRAATMTILRCAVLRTSEVIGTTDFGHKAVVGCADCQVWAGLPATQRQALHKWPLSRCRCDLYAAPPSGCSPPSPTNRRCPPPYRATSLSPSSSRSIASISSKPSTAERICASSATLAASESTTPLPKSISIWRCSSAMTA